ncbi:MAG: energy transducer TonB, partial [Leptospiraceae bacterium]|nr:energy transducer TonB [Leptospiraceae bacterium]
NNNLLTIQLSKGSIISLKLNNSKTEKTFSKETNNPTNTNNSSPKGTISEEIQKFKNQLSFPEDALEQGLESNCEWIVTVGKEGKAEKIRNIRACKYKIFEKEFLESIGNWKFDLEEGEEISIPVNFRIQEK